MAGWGLGGLWSWFPECLGASRHPEPRGVPKYVGGGTVLSLRHVPLLIGSCHVTVLGWALEVRP